MPRLQGLLASNPAEPAVAHPGTENPGARDPEASGRLQRLRRMQALATGLLGMMAAVFLGASLLERRWSAAGYVRAFAEAAMVGGCADWFAVTALFRRPLGLAIPHTAIIPRSKDRIGAALGRFIVENFLDPAVLDVKLRQLELAAWGGDWLQRPQTARALARRLARIGPELLRIAPRHALEDIVGSLALAIARATPAAPTASALLAAIWDKGRAQPLVDRAAELLADYLEQNQEVILEKVQSQSWRWLPNWVDRAITRKITRGLLQLLTDVRQPDHPWRAKLGAAVETLIDRLANDPQMQRQGEALKRQLLDDPRLGRHAYRLWTELTRRVEAGGLRDTAGLEAKAQTLIQQLGGWLRDDADVQQTLNATARTLLLRVIAPHRAEIGRFVAQVVEGWDAQGVVERLELQVGPDLQFIRVNGTLVGGLVGLGLYAFSRLAGLT